MARRSIEKVEERLKARIAEEEADLVVRKQEFERQVTKIRAMQDALREIQAPAESDEKGASE